MTAPSTDRLRRVDALFDAALDIPTGERPAFIEQASAGDAALRDEVLELVRAYGDDSFLESPAADLAAPLIESARAMSGEAPDRIGAFRVVREIGRGGMGRVFLGERADGLFEQRVALKLIQHGGTPGIARRFIEERRILAMLEHPGIARLVDGGVAAGGVPYFAMELVDGEPIDRWCESRELPLEKRLDLFAAVCDAVAYAHRYLVIHRDLKPSNILVTREGQPKLLDFGIAKVLGPHGADDEHTRTGFSVMTPEFAAPEQIRNAPVSTATDVYSLGVLLYLLVAGVRPYEVRGRTPSEIERIVCDEETPRPSAKASPRLARALRGDLDVIVMTALQKDPERRYRSPAALAEDVRRFRAGHAILARPESTVYRLRKFAGRHRASVAAATIALGMLAAAGSRERVLRHRAEVEATKAKEVGAFLAGVFEVADPTATADVEGGKVTARELLDRGARRIDSTLVGQPEVQAELRGVLGRVYTNLGLYESAVPLLRRSLGQRRSDRDVAAAEVAETMDLLGTALTQVNKFDEAERLLRDALTRRRQLFGDTSTAAAQTIQHLAALHAERGEVAAAERLRRDALEIHRVVSGDSSLEVADALDGIGVLLRSRGAAAEAESLLTRALDIRTRRLGEQHALTASSMQSLAVVLQTRGKLAQAESYQRRALAAKRAVLGNAHPSVTISLNNLANLLMRDMDRVDEAEVLVREALALDRQIFGNRHSYVAESLRNLANCLRLRGRFVEADSVLREALEMNREVFGPRHQHVALNLNALAMVRAAMNDREAAISYARQSNALYRAVLGPEHPSTTTTASSLGFFLAEFGDATEAESVLRAVATKIDPVKPEQRSVRLSTSLGLGKALLAQGRARDALPELERAVKMATAQFGEGNARTGDALLTYGMALAALRRETEAKRVLLASRTALEKNAKLNARLLARANTAIARVSG